MKSILGFLEEIEKLAYKILLWIIFIPKTIVQITLHPEWAPDYVKGELKQDESPFDEYMSPVILLLVVALIPAVIYQYLPTFGVTVTKHVEEESARQDTIEYWISQNFPVPENTYDAETTFASLSTDMKQRYEWYVEEILYDENGNFNGYDVIYEEFHDETDENVYIEHTALNTTKDTFYFPFEKPGEYYINVSVTKYDPEHDNRPLEKYDSYLYVLVPDTNNEEMKGYIFESSTKSKGDNTRINIDLISGQLKKESNIFLVFGLLIPPLFFAFATNFFTRKEISENALREAFYVECYYFAPISLAIWATFYAGRFLTNDVFYYYDASILIVFLPTLLAIIWFISVETQAIAKEENIVWWKAFLIVLFCVTVLLLVGAFVSSFAVLSIQDGIRKLAIWLYPLAGIALLIILATSAVKTRRRENQRITRADTFSFGCLFLVIVVTLGFILLVGRTAPLEEFVAAETASFDAAQPSLPDTQMTPEVTEPPTATVVLDTPSADVQSFYTEDFDGSLDSWFRLMPPDMASQVNMGVNQGALIFQLSPRDNKVPNVYFINGAFQYADVQVETVATNNGNNANQASLICRYSDNGWYEFNISFGGNYSIYAVDAIGAVKQGYNLLINGGSAEIKLGHVTNVYTATCRGSQLTLSVNGTQVETLEETTYNFAEGNIGIGASSDEALPVDVQFESVTVSEP